MVDQAPRELTIDFAMENLAKRQLQQNELFELQTS